MPPTPRLRPHPDRSRGRTGTMLRIVREAMSRRHDQETIAPHARRPGQVRPQGRDPGPARLDAARRDRLPHGRRALADGEGPAVEDLFHGDRPPGDPAAPGPADRHPHRRRTAGSPDREARGRGRIGGHAEGGRAPGGPGDARADRGGRGTMGRARPGAGAAEARPAGGPGDPGAEQAGHLATPGGDVAQVERGAPGRAASGRRHGPEAARAAPRRNSPARSFCAVGGPPRSRSCPTSKRS